MPRIVLATHVKDILMAEHKTPDVDPVVLKDSLVMWSSFVVIGKYSIIAIAVFLVLLALAFVKFF